MRHDRVIKLIKLPEEVYDDTTGDYTVGPGVEVEKLAHISDTGTQSMNLLYGKIREGAKTFRLKGELVAPFDYIQFGNDIYDVTMRRDVRDSVILHVVKRQ